MTNTQPLESVDPYAAWAADPTPDKLRSVVDTLDPVIKGAASQYGDRPVVYQRARLLAAKAVKTYDPSKGPLRPYVSTSLQELRRVVPQLTDPLPKAERLRRDSAKVWSQIEQAKNDLGREASDEEIATLIGMPVKRVAKVRNQMRGTVAMSAIEESDGDNENDDVVVNRRTHRDVWIDAVYDDLGAIDKQVFNMATGRQGQRQHLPGEIAKALRLSPSAVSQRLNKIRGMIQEYDRE